MIEVFYTSGFGIVPKNLMRDDTVSAQAKAIFSYLACFANKDGDCYPSRSLMCKELGFSKDTLTKYTNELKEHGYLIVTQSKDGNKFAKNIYHLIPCPKISDTRTSDTKDWSLTIPNNNNTNINNNIKTTKKKEAKKRYGQYKNVKLTDKELDSLIADYGKEIIDEYITKLDEGIELKGYKYKNFNLAMRNWLRNAKITPLEAKDPKKEQEQAAADEEYFTKLLEEQMKGNKLG